MNSGWFSCDLWPAREEHRGGWAAASTSWRHGGAVAYHGGAGASSSRQESSSTWLELRRPKQEGGAIGPAGRGRVRSGRQHSVAYRVRVKVSWLFTEGEWRHSVSSGISRTYESAGSGIRRGINGRRKATAMTMSSYPGRPRWWTGAQRLDRRLLYAQKNGAGRHRPGRPIGQAVSTQQLIFQIQINPKSS
jgi:hypothetical protein